MVRPQGRYYRGGSQNSQGHDRSLRICFSFQRGACRYGSKCKFSHDLTANEATAGAAKPGLSEEEAEAKQQYFRWKALIRKHPYPSYRAYYDDARLLEVWNSALAILDGSEREHHQMLIRDLVDDQLDGHNLIITTASKSHHDSTRFFQIAEAFLKVLTHTSLLNCLSVDAFVGTMYTSFAGTNGDRAIRFLENACNALTERGQIADEVGLSSTADLVKLFLSALHHLLSRDRRARLHDKLPSLLSLFDTLADVHQTDADSLKVSLDYLKRLLRQATSNFATAEKNQADLAETRPAQSSFPIEAQVPGGRHDNDFADISQIQILPTRGEILSDDPEYLPSTNFLQPHVLEDPLERYIDSNFRLLRHDVFGSLKDVLRELLKHDDATRAPYLSSKDTRASLYSGSKIQHVFINGKHELEAVLSFSPPPQVCKKSLPEQREWWQISSRLDEGTLVCFMAADTAKSLLFLQVTVKSTSTSDKAQSNLVSANQLPTITVKLASCVRSDLNLLLQLYRHKTRGVLVDFPNIIPATFSPILKNLQRIQTEGDLSLKHWILPNPDSEGRAIPPPMYATRPGFVFHLDPIIKDTTETARVKPGSPVEDIDLLKVEALTGLDRGQCEGLLAALTREYALIQGPPGTGKSYVGVQLVRVLLAAKARANLGPIIVICYTNHALDQFLKHLLDVGIEKIIRIGGRSQASELDGKNLNLVRREMTKTRVEQQELGQSYNKLETCMKIAGYSMRHHHKSRAGLSWDVLQPFLSRHKPLIYRQLTPKDADGFVKVGRDPLKSWLGKKEPNAVQLSAEEVISQTRLRELERISAQDVNQVAPADRWELAERWLEEHLDGQSAAIFEAVDEAEGLRATIHDIHEEVSRRTLTQADVIGITTTSLAKNIKTLQRVGAKIVICEEAGEVKEADVISALMTSVEHFIQIGDHRQLRPQIQNYSLSLESQTGLVWQLDRSQFERRAQGEPGMHPAPVAQLKVQRRMRPEISQLIRRVYPTLQDHESVMNLPNVIGMQHNLFWLDHRCDEDSRNDGARVKSHSNQWEVDMATALVRHLVRQGKYKHDDIALLTPYTGQLQKLKGALGKDFEICLSERDQEALAADGFENTADDDDSDENGPKLMEKKPLLQTLRLATVDNFQGEEAKVIVVSLVRSNPKHKVGFLRTENRINVLLSRAQHGMYLIGNSETYLEVPMWADVHGQLVRMNAVGTEIALCCPRHPDDPILCSEPDDFARKSPEGGCNLPCTLRLEPCGHRCQASCHSDMMHNGFSCSQPCPRIRTTCEHKCPKLCGQDCGPCNVILHEDVALPCGHLKSKLRCHQIQDLASIRCEAMVTRTVPNCGHNVQVPCFRDVTSDIFRCTQRCTEVFGCGHVCPSSCGKCRKEGHGGAILFEHQRCTKKCDRPHGACNHRCPLLCHGRDNCGNCQAPCEVRCPHSGCASRCGKPCAPCIEPCGWHCEHQGSCSMPCAAPCNRLPCDERCNKTLDCGHRCPSFCGEDCPGGFCQACGENADARVDLLEFKPFSEINLDESPIVVLPCGHAFTGESLDGLVGLDEVYTRDEAGNFNGLADVSVSLATRVPSCPDCKRPIRQFASKRYNRVINRAVMDEICKRFLTTGRQELSGLESRLEMIQNDLDTTRNDLEGSPISLSSIRSRHAASSSLANEAMSLSKRMTTENQPSRKLLDAIKFSQSRASDAEASISEQLSKLKISRSAFDDQITLGAQLVRFRAMEALLHDFFAVASLADRYAVEIPVRRPYKLLVTYLKDCRRLVSQAKEAKLSRIAILATLSFAKMVNLEAWYRRTHPEEPAEDSSSRREAAHEVLDVSSTRKRSETARVLLGEAMDLCTELADGGELLERVQQMVRLFEGPRYEEVTPEELASIKTAMVTGQGGIATNSGHWYNCVNGHPFAIGECGMPMETARCPECGASIGGQNHDPVDGVTRAMNME